MYSNKGFYKKWLGSKVWVFGRELSRHWCHWGWYMLQKRWHQGSILFAQYKEGNLSKSADYSKDRSEWYGLLFALCKSDCKSCGRSPRRKSYENVGS